MREPGGTTTRTLKTKQLKNHTKKGRKGGEGGKWMSRRMAWENTLDCYQAHELATPSPAVGAGCWLHKWR